MSDQDSEQFTLVDHPFRKRKSKPPQVSRSETGSEPERRLSTIRISRHEEDSDENKSQPPASIYADNFDDLKSEPDPNARQHPPPVPSADMVHYDRDALMSGVLEEEIQHVEKKQKWVPYIPHQFDAERLDAQELEYIADKDWCFMCWFSESTYRNDKYAILKMFRRFIMENWDKVDRTTLAKMAQQLYRKKVWSEFQGVDGMKPWPLKQIIYHYTRHEIIPFIHNEENIRRLTHALDVVYYSEMHQYEENGGGDVRIGKEALQKFLTIKKQIDCDQHKAAGMRSQALI